MSFTTTYQVGGRFDFPFFPTKQKPFVKGRRILVSSSLVVDEYTVPSDMEFLTMSIGCSRYKDSDNWNLKVDNELVFDEVYTKDVPEGFYFMVVREVKAGQVIRFEYMNNSMTSKTVWLNYQFLKD